MARLSSASPPLRLSASWLLPLDDDPIPDAAVLIGDDGRVAVAGPDAAVPRPEGTPEEHLPGAVLMPGLVNAHTHLELTGLSSDGERGEFPAWIGGIRRAKERRSPEQYRAAAEQGLAECWKSGVTTVADTGDSGVVPAVLHELGGRGVVFHEVFGPHPDQAPSSLGLLERAIERLAALESDRVTIGVSPHAPYTVSGPLYRAVARFAAGQGLPVAVHLAESRAESELIGQGQGPFAEAWRARGIPLPDDIRQLDLPLPIRTPVRWLDAFEVLAPGTLCIHVVQADPGDIALLARRGVAIAHCPGSNAAHGHGDAPLAEFLAAGIPVGVGTDSSASVGPLDLFAELRLARRLGRLTPRETLRLGTVEGALAVGVSDVGVVAPGAWADLIAVTVGAAAPGDVEAAVLEASSGAVRAAWVAGRAVYRA